MLITGTLMKKYDTKLITDKFQVREFILSHTEAKQPQDIILQLQQDDCGRLNDISIGDQVQVSFVIHGRVWDSRYFNTLIATAIKTL